MRAGLSTIQQTLTPEAANVLNLSIAEAGKRNHGQTTPLHVAATLLASPSGYLRQACMRSHPNSSHPLQCRALDLCFSVALDRLPSNQNLNSSSGEPPISNALMAALKRAQAHQRRGCPEQQQQPLLAVKVELEQLIVSILDDPGVSRVMREASFSSPSVKATIEQSLNQVNPVAAMPAVGSGFRNLPNRSLYMNPRLQPGNSTVSNSNSNFNPSSNFKPNPNLNVNLDQFGQRRREEVRKVIEILLRDKKKNPVLVGELEPELVVKELLSKIQKMELAEPSLRNVQIISLEKEIGSDRTQILMKMKELGGLIESKIGSNAGGVILDVGDLKWLVEQPGGFAGMVSAQQGLSEVGRGAVAEMGKILARFADGRLWLVGTATCETYLRCQVYHPSMENDWDLQAVPIAAKVPLPGLFQRMGGNGILGSSVESGTPLKGFPAMNSFFSRRPSENIDPGHKTKCCALCTQSYEQELAKLVAKDSEKSSESKPEATRQSLPQWLQNAKLNNGNTNVKTIDQSQTKEQEVVIKTKTEELQRKWNDTCLRLHPSFHHNVSTERLSPATLSMASLYNARPLGRQSFQPKLQLTRNLSLGVSLQLNQSPMPQPTAERVVTPPGSPVKTDLVLGSPKITEVTQKEQPLIELIPSEPLERLSESNREKLANILDPDSFKSLFKALTEKVSWQKEAASVVAANVIQGRLGNNRRKGFGRKDDTWLLFAGPDRVGKKKMAMALSELVCRTVPVIIKLGRRGGSDDDDDAEGAFRGKTILDRIVEAVQRNPSAVIMLEDIDQADMLVYPSIKRAIERGRLPDSYGREINLNNVVFILTTSGVPENLKGLSNSTSVQEEKLADLASSGWNLQLSVGGKNVKRRADWPLEDENTATKSRTEDGSGFSFDLNEAATVEEDTAEGSRNSSDLTVELDNEHNLINKQFQSVATAVSREIFSGVDETIVFKAVDFEAVQSKVASTIVSKFSAIIKDGKHIEVNSEALEHIAGGVWFGEVEVEEWAEKVLVPSFLTLSNTLKSTENDNTNSVVKLVAVKDSERRRDDGGDWLPSKVTLVDIEG